jgi:hypothetical protein
MKGLACGLIPSLIPSGRHALHRATRAWPRHPTLRRACPFDCAQGGRPDSVRDGYGHIRFRPYGSGGVNYGCRHGRRFWRIERWNSYEWVKSYGTDG